MALNWGSVSVSGGDLSDPDREAVKKLLDEFADLVEVKLGVLGLANHMSLLWRPWHIYVFFDSVKISVAFSPNTGGVSEQRWYDKKSEDLSTELIAPSLREELGITVESLVILPKPDSVNRDEKLETAVEHHVGEVERASRLGRLGDLTGIRHLEPHLREFMNDHPNPERNVFVMMRFQRSEQLDEIHLAIKTTLAARGLHAVRADDRDYTGELWSNIEVYLTCSQYGIAVFETINSTDFNPNVSLELGYMLGRRKRILILKEQRLSAMPADVVHRLYKSFDMFNLERSISLELGRWIDVDLRLT